MRVCGRERGTGYREQGQSGHVWLAVPDILDHSKDRVVVGYTRECRYTGPGVGMVV